MKKVRLTIRFTEEELSGIQNLRLNKKQTASQVIREAVRFYVCSKANQIDSSSPQ